MAVAALVSPVHVARLEAAAWLGLYVFRKAAPPKWNSRLLMGGHQGADEGPPFAPFQHEYNAHIGRTLLKPIHMSLLPRLAHLLPPVAEREFDVDVAAPVLRSSG